VLDASARTPSPSSERKKKGEGSRLQGDQLGMCLVYLFGFCRNTRKRRCITVISCGVKSNQTVLLSLSCGELWGDCELACLAWEKADPGKCRKRGRLDPASTWTYHPAVETRIESGEPYLGTWGNNLEVWTSVPQTLPRIKRHVFLSRLINHESKTIPSRVEANQQASAAPLKANET
jgi:hypothetical protein